MEQYGNTSSFNVESVLRKNIVDSEYFRDTCGKLSTWGEVVDQIYYDVTSVEPWMSGNARGASTAFCLLYRSAVHLADHRTGGEGPGHPCGLALHTCGAHSCLAALCPSWHAMRLACCRWAFCTFGTWPIPGLSGAGSSPMSGMRRFNPSPEPHGKEVAMGDYVRDVFLELYYFETIFPRVPKPQQDDFVSKLTSMGLPSRAVGNGGQGGTDRRGIEEANRRPASVKASLSVAFGQRAPNRPTAREEGRGMGAGMKGALGAAGAPRPGASHTDRDTDPRDRPAETRKEPRREERPRDAERNGHASGSRHRDEERHRDRHGERSHRDSRDERPHKRPRSREPDGRHGADARGSSRHGDDRSSHRREPDRRHHDSGRRERY